MRKHSKRDASNTNITVYGMSAINEPNLPPISTKPLKAKTVVIVAVKTGSPIKVAAFFAALYGSSFKIDARNLHVQLPQSHHQPQSPNRLLKQKVISY